VKYVGSSRKILRVAQTGSKFALRPIVYFVLTLNADFTSSPTLGPIHVLMGSVKKAILILELEGHGLIMCLTCILPGNIGDVSTVPNQQGLGLK
jgi:hypothetical protein